MVAEKQTWLRQAKGTVVCGAVAVLNARRWLGEKVLARDIQPLADRLGISVEADGISGSNLNRWLRKKSTFGVVRQVQPSWKKVASVLKKGHGVILRYVWRVEGRQGAHYVFLAPAEKGLGVIANPHRLTARAQRAHSRILTEEELFEICRPVRIGMRTYPWIWVIERPGGPKS